MQLDKYAAELMERAGHRKQGTYFQQYGYRPVPSKYGDLSRDLTAVRHTLHNAVSHLPQEITDGLILLVRFTIGNNPKLEEAPMAVWLEKHTGTIRLGVNVHWIDIMMDMHTENRLRPTAHGIYSEIQTMVLHELWHVLKGHNYLPPEKLSDPIWLMAMEISINDGVLGSRIEELTYPAVSAKTMGILKDMQRIAEELGLPQDWLVHDHHVYRVLLHLYKDNIFTVSVEECSCDSGTGQGQGQGAPHRVVVVTNVGTGERYVYHDWQLGGDARQADSQDVVDTVHKNIVDTTDSRWKYDPVHRSFQYDHAAPQDADRYILPRATIIPWHRIRTLLAIKRVLGYNRRIGHSLPPECQKLSTRRYKRRERIAVFIDSSGSIDNELISAFIHTVRQSPYQVEVKFFSTEVLDKPHTGGTDFRCIEQYLLRQPRYPKAVLVLTDGYAEANFTPRYPRRWYWVVVGDPSVPRRIGGTVWEARVIGGDR